MKQIRIQGGNKLTGSIKISGAKNSAVALIPASLLSDEVVAIDNVPNISDVKVLSDTIKYLGGSVKKNDQLLEISLEKLVNKPIYEEFSSKLRASYYFMGALLGKYKKVDIFFTPRAPMGPFSITTFSGSRFMDVASVMEKCNPFLSTATYRQFRIFLMISPKASVTIAR